MKKLLFTILISATGTSVSAQQVLLVPTKAPQSAAGEASAAVPSSTNPSAAPANGRQAAILAIPDKNTPAPAIVQKPKPKFDAAKVHPEVAIKKLPPKEITLPGVMDVAGAKTALNVNERTIEVNGRGTHVVYLSKKDSNLVVTPFPNPLVITTDGLVAGKTEGNNVFLSIKDQEAKSFQIWLKDANDNSNIIGMNVVPKNDIPAQMVTFVLKGGVDSGQTSDLSGKSGPIVTGLSDRLAKLAQGKKPQGYSVDDASGYPTVAKNGLLIKPLLRYSSNRDDIWEYDVTNASSTVATVTKLDFCTVRNGECTSDVIAVSIFPTDNLAPGGRTKAFVVAPKAKESQQ